MQCGKAPGLPGLIMLVTLVSGQLNLAGPLKCLTFLFDHTIHVP